ncbi:MAG: hypothetical protein ACO1OX_07650 [Novosphingobium sp.]
MPAYRSPDEGEVREAVVARLRQMMPAARIMHEVNAASFGNRIDVLAVDRAEIVAVEIKSKKDKLDRLPDQIKAMTRVAHHVIVALHEKFLVETPTNQWAAHTERDGKFYRAALPDVVDRLGTKVVPWVYPLRDRSIKAGGYNDYPWLAPTLLAEALPSGALDMLWQAELVTMCARHRVPANRRATMDFMRRALRWHLTGAELTHAICAALRARECIEADPAIPFEQESRNAA